MKISSFDSNRFAGAGTWFRISGAQVFRARAVVCGLMLAAFLVDFHAFAAGKDGPSRPPVPRCAWEKIADARGHELHATLQNS